MSTVHVACTRFLRRLAPGILLLGLSPVFWHAQAGVTTYQITPAQEGNRVEFLSKAPLESFKGHTNIVQGEIVCDPTQLGDSVIVRIEVDLTSLTTGMKLRDQHMRENHLQTDRFPHATFRGARVLPGSASELRRGEEVEIILAGTFELHGKTRPLEITVTVMLADTAPEGLSIECDFPIKLSDYEIKRPKFLLLKLSDEQKVSVRLAAQAGESNR